MTRAVLRNPSARAGWLFASLMDRALSHWVRAPPLDGGDDDDDADIGTDTTTPDDDNEDIAILTSQQSTFLLLKHRSVARSHLLGAACSLMFRHVSELEALFLEPQVLVNRHKEVYFLSDLAVAFAFTPHTGEFTLHFLDQTHIWSGSGSDVIEFDDILALAAAVYMFIKLHLSPQHSLDQSQRYFPGSNLMMFRCSTMRNQQVAHVEFRLLEQMGYEVAPMGWVDIFRRRFSLRQQQQRPQSNFFVRLQPAVPTESSRVTRK